LGQVGNYVNNGSFEEYYNCTFPYGHFDSKNWSSIDSNSYGGEFLSTCRNTIPLNANTYQFPRTGNSCMICGFYCPVCTRGYLKNRLSSNLISSKIYCVKFFVNIANSSPRGMDGFGVYFSDNSLDTITKCNIPLTYLAPQIQNPQGNVISDTVNWVAISGTFVATGQEKYMLIGNFLADSSVSTTPIYTPSFPEYWTDVLIDDVSCIELNLAAYAGPDKSIIPADSTYIGRESDFAIDPGCIWYKLPNTTVAIDTISGLWVKPTVTTTYVVKQTLDCSPEKWDTVVVYMNLVGIEKIRMLNEELKIYPVPAKDFIELKISNRALFEGFNSIALYNNLGQLIKEEEISFKEDKLIISTIDFKPGVYVLKIKSNTYGTLSQRFLISQYH
jgi:hypothetical protein